MTFGSLFAGIGGFDLGLERAGMKCCWQVEKDPFCQKVLAKHWPDVKRYKDIKDVKKPESVDLVCGGFPCQPFSVAGKRNGANDDRYIRPEMLRIIREIRPRWVIAENVPGIVRMALDTVLSDMEGQGYSCRAVIIPACAVDAPHRRDRVWIIANTDSERLQKCVTATIPERPGFYCRGSDQGRREWAPESGVHRVDDGVSGRVDRIRALGNAVVPQVVEQIGKIIIGIEGQQKTRWEG